MTYEVGVARAEARITELMDAPAPVFVAEPSGPVAGSAEWSAQRLAAKLLAEDARIEAARTRDVPDVVVGEYDTDAAERRAKALAAAAWHQPAQRLGPNRGAEALQLPGGRLVLVERGNDGQIQSMTSAVVQVEDIGPNQWDAHSARWEARQRVAENELLCRYYGKEAAVTAGWLTQAEADQLGAPL